MVDLSYFFVNSLLVEVLTVFTLTPALILFDWARVDAVSQRVGALPLPAQVCAMVLVADLTQYWVHRTFHTVVKDVHDVKINMYPEDQLRVGTADRKSVV